jgi:hypothetical protein
MRRLAAAAAVAVALAAAAGVVAPAASSAPTKWSAHALFDAHNPFTSDPCWRMKLDLQVTETSAYVDYWGVNTCWNQEFDHLTGTKMFTPDQVLISHGSASVTNVVVDVSSIPGGWGYIQKFTLNLAFDQAGHPTVSHPSADNPDATKNVPATVSGTVVDLGGSQLLTGADVSDADFFRPLHAA